MLALETEPNLEPIKTPGLDPDLDKGGSHSAASLEDQPAPLPVVLPAEPGQETGAPPPLPPSVAARTIRDALIDVLLSLCVTGTVIVAMSGVIMLRMRQGGKFTPTLGWTIAALAATEVAFVITGLRRMRLNREKGVAVFPMSGGAILPAISWGVLGAVVLGLLSSAYSLLLKQVLQIKDIPNPVSILDIAQGQPAMLAALVVIATVLAPVSEEIFFRGAIFGSAFGSGNRVRGVIVATIAFACLHFSAMLFPYYCAFSLILCFLYARCRHIVAPITAHMLLNGLACWAALYKQTSI
jgi:membrane protease YdiL (CAAX protease family)